MHIYNDLLLKFPKEEKYELASQVKRAAYSISLNIVEGCGRFSDKDFVRFLDMALGSAQEVEYCLLLAFDLNYLNNFDFQLSNKKIGEVKATLIALIKSIRLKEESKKQETESEKMQSKKLIALNKNNILMLWVFSLRH